MSSAEEVVLTNSKRVLARRFFARVTFAFLLGLSVPAFATMFDFIFMPSPRLTLLAGQALVILILVVLVNTVCIGLVTFTSYLSKSAKPPIWVLPVSLGVLTGLVLAVTIEMGMERSHQYPNAASGFLVGGVAGILVGIAYTLSIPGIRQDTIFKQSRHSVFIGGMVGILYGIYFLIRAYPQFSAETLPYHLASAISLPLAISGMLLSFVLGIELGDRYVERKEERANT